MFRLLLASLIVPVVAHAADTEPAAPKGGKPIVVSTPAAVVFEDEPLPEGARWRFGAMRRWHGIQEGILTSPDGKYQYAAFADQRIRRWESATGKLAGITKAFESSVHRISLSPDGRLLAIATGTKVHLIDAQHLEKDSEVLVGQTDTITKTSFSHDGKRLAAGGHGTISVRDVSKQQNPRVRSRDVDDALCNILFTSDDQYVISATDSGIVNLWKSDSLEPVRSFAKVKSLQGISVHPNGETLIGRTYKDGLVFWSIKTGEIARTLPNLKGCGYVSPDGRWAVVSPARGGQGPTSVVDITSGKEAFQLASHRTGAFRFGFSPDLRTLTSYGDDETLRRWDMATGREIGVPVGHQHRVTGAAFLNRDRQVVTASKDGTIRFVDAKSGTEVRRISAEGKFFQALAVSPDESMLAFSGSPTSQSNRWDHDEANQACNLYFWDLKNHRQIDCFYLPGEMAYNLQFSADGRQVFVLNHDQVTIKEVKTGKSRSPFPKASQRLIAAALSPDGKYLATSTEPHLRQVGKFAFRDADTGKEQFSRSYKFGSFNDVAWSPDSKYLAVAGIEGRQQEKGLGLWKANSDEVARKMITTRQDHERLAYSPDGRLLAAADPDYISIFETCTGQERRRFQNEHMDSIRRLMFSGDSKLLVSAGNDTLVYLWDVADPVAAKMELESRALDSFRAAMADTDGLAADQAIRSMIASPTTAVPYLKQRLRVITLADRKAIDQWIIDLDSEQFRVRDRAGKALEDAGDAALPALTKAAETAKTEEVRSKAALILKKIGPGDDPAISKVGRQAVRAVEVLERIGTPEALIVLADLAERGHVRAAHVDAKAAIVRASRGDAR